MKEKKEEVTMSAQDRYRFIRGEFVRRGLTNIGIAEEAGVSRQRLLDVMIGKSKGYRIRLLIAEKIQMPVQNIWPDTPDQYLKAA